MLLFQWFPVTYLIYSSHNSISFVNFWFNSLLIFVVQISDWLQSIFSVNFQAALKRFRVVPRGTRLAQAFIIYQWVELLDKERWEAVVPAWCLFNSTICLYLLHLRERLLLDCQISVLLGVFGKLSSVMTSLFCYLYWSLNTTGASLLRWLLPCILLIRKSCGVDPIVRGASICVSSPLNHNLWPVISFLIEIVPFL